MPNALITLPDVYESVTRRVAIDVTEQLARLMRLPGDTEVYLPGNTESVPMNGGSFNECWDNTVRYPSEARLVVRFTETVSEENSLAVTVAKPQHMPFFHDEQRDVRIQPVYRYVTLTVNVEYFAPNITIAQRWLDEMRSRYSMGRAEIYQDLEYHYAVPTPVLYLLHHLHETIEASPTPLNQTFKEYFDAHRYLPVKTATTLVGTEPVITVPEHQHEVLGWFDFTATPATPEKDASDTGVYNVGFSYELRYNRPVQMYCQYPILLHNNPVGPDFRPKEPYTTFKRYDRRVSSRKGNFDALRAQMEVKGVPYIHYPSYDDWIPARHPKNRLTFFTGLLVIDKDDPSTLISLANLGDFAFSPYFLEYFYTIGDRTFDKSTGIFEFRLYENNTLRTSTEFTLDGVTLKTTLTLDPTKYYHLQISLKKDWHRIHRDTIECLRRYPTVTYWALKALGVTLGGQPEPFVNKLGETRPRPASSTCPGEGSIIGPPRWSFTSPTGIMNPPKGWEDWSGGQWPWPWLGDNWVGIPWPGSVPDGWLETPWPDFNFPGTYPPGYGHPPNTPIPDDVILWPGMHPYPGMGSVNQDGLPGPNDYPFWGRDPNSSYPGYPGYAASPIWGSFPTGTLTGKDIWDAVNQTTQRSGNPGGSDGFGMVTVLYGEILTFKQV